MLESLIGSLLAMYLGYLIKTYKVIIVKRKQ